MKVSLTLIEVEEAIRMYVSKRTGINATKFEWEELPKSDNGKSIFQVVTCSETKQNSIEELEKISNERP